MRRGRIFGRTRGERGMSLVEVLMSDKYSREVALGIHDDARMAADYALVAEYIGVEKPFDVKSVYTNEFLDRSVKMTK